MPHQEGVGGKSEQPEQGLGSWFKLLKKVFIQ